MGTLLQSSILNTIKQMLGIDETFNGFDPEIIIDINSALMTLHQLGIGPSDGFQIVSESDVWEDLTVDVSQLNGIKTYISRPDCCLILHQIHSSCNLWKSKFKSLNGD